MKGYADIGIRFLAMIIDRIILFVVEYLLTYLLIVRTIGVLGPIWYLILILINLAYYVGFEGGPWHATIGKHILGLTIVDEYGRGINYSTSMLRYLGKILSAITLGIGYLLAFFSDKKQTLHDMLAHTYVVNTSEARDSAKQQIICLGGVNAGKTYPVGSGGVLIGRDSQTCGIVFPSSEAGISRSHCLVTYNPSSRMFVVNDRNSTCGTFKENGRRITPGSPAVLGSGERFYIASAKNMFEVRNFK